ncbi:hypothetical protein PTI98_002231 [Pleurotus ostreatus]|nr:hypothetical protein PTI98_002231 [Pleurotus ostreatus]
MNNHQEAETTSANNINNTDYARRCKELMQLRNDLDAMGASALLDLPRVVVIGSQSAGKSSLVEGVSGVRGTATIFAYQANEWYRSVFLETLEHAPDALWNVSCTARPVLGGVQSLCGKKAEQPAHSALK